MMSAKVHPTTANTNDGNDSIIKQLKKLLHRLDPSLYAQCATELKADGTAIEVLLKLGFVQQAEHVAAKLPPALRNFHILKEEKNVAKALNDPSFLAAQTEMQTRPSLKNVKILKNEIKKLIPIYTTAIETRLKTNGMICLLNNVIIIMISKIEFIVININSNNSVVDGGQ